MNSANEGIYDVAVDEIAASAHAAVAENRRVTDCPFPDGSEARRRWQIYFHARQKELREDVEV